MLLLLTAPLAIGCLLLARAGRLERAGRWSQARRAARTAGFVAGTGSIYGAGGALLLLPGPSTTRVVVAASMLASGGAALLAGLSGKPRPTVWPSLACLAAAVVVASRLVR